MIDAIPPRESQMTSVAFVMASIESAPIGRMTIDDLA